VREWFGSWRAILRLAPGALWAAIRHNVLPTEYYQYALWRPEYRQNIDNYLYASESPRLFKLLNSPAHVSLIRDKLAFYEMCKTDGIPTPEVIAVFTPTVQLLEFRSGLPPQCDIFVKPRTGQGGEGTEHFKWDGDCFKSNRGLSITPGRLGNYLTQRAQAENRTLLAQPALSNHPDFGAEPNEALATARLVTGRSIDGQVIPIFCYMLWGIPGKITANSDCVTLIDVATGRFLPAPPRGSPGMLIYEYREFACHDARVPDWDAAVHHAEAAHKACSGLVFIGWDVVFTPDGAAVLEGNTTWSPTTFQALQSKPLGCTKLADILATHVRNELI
jgi:hypothetical protein